MATRIVLALSDLLCRRGLGWGGLSCRRVAGGADDDLGWSREVEWWWC